eukprot:m.210184 g.210184  ORF g.210184 m.210184 type:complete len:56 (-) comp15049_c0_seq1:586-753(-)
MKLDVSTCAREQLFGTRSLVEGTLAVACASCVAHVGGEVHAAEDVGDACPGEQFG